MSATMADPLRAADDRIGPCGADAARARGEAVRECAARTAPTAARPRPATRPPHVGVPLNDVPEPVFPLAGGAPSGDVVVSQGIGRGEAGPAGDTRAAGPGLIVTGRATPPSPRRSPAARREKEIMDFELDENARDLRDLAAGLLARGATRERLEAHERSAAPYDAELWTAMARAGLLTACLPEDIGGDGLGAIGLAVILREIGAYAAPVPAYAALVAAVTLARHGTREQSGWLAGFADGRTLLTAAVREPGAGAGADPAATAHRDGDGYVLRGVKTFVPCAAHAGCVLVPARIGDETRVFLVEPEAAACSPQPSATGEPLYRLGLDGVRAGAEAMLGPGAYETLSGLAVAGAVAIVSGALDAALRLTTEHVRGRRQFERALAEFQAVTMQVGDVYIAKRALDVALWAGAWRLARGREDSGEVLAVAAWNACEPAHQAFYTCQHLHGGLGLDVTYPLHRYFACAEHYAHLLGGADAQLDAIGALVA